MESLKWVFRAAFNAVLGGALGAGIPYAVNTASSLLGGKASVVPTDGFTQTLLAVFIFLTMLMVELALDFRSEISSLRRELPKTVGESLKRDLDTTIDRGFATSMARSLSADPASAKAIASFLSLYFSALERVPKSRRSVAALLANLRGSKFIESIDDAINDGFEVSSTEGLQIEQALVDSADSYIVIDQGIYEWTTYWTPAWHEFANRLRANSVVDKHWISLQPRTKFKTEKESLASLRSYVVRHGFDYRQVEKERVEQALAQQIDNIVRFETMEVIGTIAVVWNTDGKGYRGRTPHVRVLDLQSASDVRRLAELARSLSRSEVNVESDTAA